MLSSFQDTQFWTIFCHNSSHIEILKSIPGTSNDLGFPKYLNTGVFLPKCKFRPSCSKIRESFEYFWDTVVPTPEMPEQAHRPRKGSSFLNRQSSKQSQWHSQEFSMGVLSGGGAPSRRAGADPQALGDFCNFSIKIMHFSDKIIILKQ